MWCEEWDIFQFYFTTNISSYFDSIGANKLYGKTLVSKLSNREQGCNIDVGVVLRVGYIQIWL